MPATISSSHGSRIAHAEILLELGDVFDAEEMVADVLDQAPGDVDALSLFAKIKHMRGELSQAIACWAQIHTRAPTSHSAIMQLRSILHLAMDPERGAGDFIALGQLQLARKPAAHLELQEAFAMFLARRPEEARARCRRIAERYRDTDPDTYKLAKLAGAWISELSGDVEGAARILEVLGEERGFATDVDRVRALVSLYQRIGTRQKLEAAVHICTYLMRRGREDIHVLAQLAALHKRLGDRALADQYERAYLVAFRHSMNRPSRFEAVGVAATHYIPLQRLRNGRLYDGGLEGPFTRREEAIRLALCDDLHPAMELFGAGESLLDRKYEADVDVLAGDEPGAIARYAAVLEQELDFDVVAWLLDRDKLPEAVEELFRRPHVVTVIGERLKREVRREPTGAARWRRLGRFWALQPNGAEQASAFFTRAKVQEDAFERSRRTVGRVLAAAVYYFVSKSKGLIHEMWAGREITSSHAGGSLPTEHVLGNLSTEMHKNVQNIFVSVREYARSKLAHLSEHILDYSYHYKVTKEDERTHGSSADLPTAVAFLSVFLQRPVPQDIAFSGTIVSDSHRALTVRAVGDTEHKVKAAYNRNLRRIILPSENRNELMANPAIPAVILDELVWFVSDFDDVVRLVFGEEVFTSQHPHEGTLVLPFP